MPVLRQVGDGWQSGELGVLHEHFVSSAFRGVLGEFRMPVQGERVRTAVLACPPHELHDLPLELFGAMLHAAGGGWSAWAPTPRWVPSTMPCATWAPTPACSPGCAARPSSPGCRRSSRLGERVPLFLAGEGALALPTPPPGVTVLPRDLTVAADGGRRRRARDLPARRRPQRARGRLTRHTVGRCESPTSDTPASSSRWPTPGCSSTRAPSPTTWATCATSRPCS